MFVYATDGCTGYRGKVSLIKIFAFTYLKFPLRTISCSLKVGFNICSVLVPGVATESDKLILSTNADAGIGHVNHPVNRKKITE